MFCPWLYSSNPLQLSFLWLGLVCGFSSVRQAGMFGHVCLSVEIVDIYVLYRALYTEEGIDWLGQQHREQTTVLN